MALTSFLIKKSCLKSQAWLELLIRLMHDRIQNTWLTLYGIPSRPGSFSFGSDLSCLFQRVDRNYIQRLSKRSLSDMWMSRYGRFYDRKLVRRASSLRQ